MAVMVLKTVLLYIMAVFNVIGAILVVCDKSRAKRKKYRIRESTLWLFSLLGGALFVFAFMLLCRHKTNHLSYMLLLPLIIAAQLILIIVI